MAEIVIPLRIIYETQGDTPVPVIVAALQAAESAIEDGISLLPSLVDGLVIERSQVRVRSLSQESPLRELLAIGLFMTYQDDLTATIPPLVKGLLGLDVSTDYDGLITLLTMVVLFYGAGFLKDAASNAITHSALKDQIDAIITDLAQRTGKDKKDIRAALDAKYSKPGAVKRLVKFVGGFFMPSQIEGGVPVGFNGQVVKSEVIREIPYAANFAESREFDRYEPHFGVTLEIHAQDRDKTATGWAAMPVGLSDKRLRMKLIEPVKSTDLWGHDKVVGDIILVKTLTADGYVPSLIHLISIRN